MSSCPPLPLPSGPVPSVPDGQWTGTVYALIRDQQYFAVINLLLQQYLIQTNHSAILPLLAYCYFATQDMSHAALCYEHLLALPYLAFHQSMEYRYYYALTLFKLGLHDEALLQCATLSTALRGKHNDQQQTAVHLNSQIDLTLLTQLQSMIHYESDDVTSASAVLDTCEEDELTMIGKACIAYKEDKYEEASQQFNDLILGQGSHVNDLAYSQAVCLYELGHYAQALKLVGDIIEDGVRNHPEFNVGALSEQKEQGYSASATFATSLTHVGNTRALAASFLVEAFNLKAAIEIQLKNMDHARESLIDMPPRQESDLDAVTLHNLALVNMEQQPDENLKKLNYIISHESGQFPKPCFHNLLISYLRYECYDLCADILAENTQLHHLLSPQIYEYLESMILLQSNPPEAYRKLQVLGEQSITELRKWTRSIQEARANNDTEEVKTFLKNYDTTLNSYMPILMAQCKIYWDIGNYEQVEQILKAHAEFCSENDTFKLNVGHCFFMQENKYKEAIKYYEFIIHKNYQSVLRIVPIILANLCVSYIMVSENEEAEELMRIIEKEEEKENNPREYYHLCIVNLVIGTLYCSKNNFEFGVSRIIKSFEPVEIKLNADTWYYAKRNMLSVCEYSAKHMLTVKGEMWRDMFSFLNDCEVHGSKIKARIGMDAAKSSSLTETAPALITIAQEAREIKRLMYKLSEQ